MVPKITRIEWMHPSWRDLVIDHLARDAASRQKFLSRCGLQGFLLALSSAGGATGERAIPLLVQPRDWQALSESLPTVLTSGPYASWSALTTVHNAIVANKGAVPNDKQPRLLKLAEELLKHLNLSWKTAPEQC